MYICKNGKIIEGLECGVSAESPCLLYGYGLFETVRVLDGKLCFYEAHMERLGLSCSMIDMDFNPDLRSLKEQAYRLIRLNKLENGSLRINYIKEDSGNSFMMLTRNKVYSRESYKKGSCLCLSQIRRNHLSPLVRIKSLNYLENILAKKEAVDRGFDEALFLNGQGHVCEGAVSNLFWVKAGQLHTPSAECGLLPGITRQQVISLSETLGININMGCYNIEELYEADEVFITNALMGIMPVRKLEESDFDISGFYLTNSLSEAYGMLLEREL